MAMQSSRHAGRADRHQEALLRVAAAAEYEVLTEESFADPNGLPEALDAMAAAVGQRVADTRTTQAELERQRNEANRLNAERLAVAEQLTDARSQAEALRRDMAERARELTEATTQHENAIKQWTERVDSLAAELLAAGAAQEDAAATIARLEIALQERVDSGEIDEAILLVVDTEETDAVEQEPEPRSGALVIPSGASHLFKTVRYDGPRQTLTFVTLNNQRLVYSGIPETVFEELSNAPVLDIYYRFRILDNFPSEPNDRELIRAIRR